MSDHYCCKICGTYGWECDCTAEDYERGYRQKKQPKSLLVRMMQAVRKQR